MTLDFSVPGKMIVDMTSYVKEMIEDFPFPLEGTVPSPAGPDLFEESKGDSNA